MLRIVFAVLAAYAWLAAPAQASTLTIDSGGILRFQVSQLSERMNFVLSGSGNTITVHRDDGDTAPVASASSGCVEVMPQGVSWRCTGVTTMLVIGGDANDRVDGTALLMPLWAFGNGGDDLLFGTRIDDVLDGGAGDDFLLGWSGDDRLRPGTGTDDVRDESGNDTVEYWQGVRQSITLDGVANDGEPGENDAIDAGIENVSVTPDQSGTVTVVGNAGPNELSSLGIWGRTDMTGGDGVDVIRGGASVDVIHARDGFRDTISCGDAVDTVEADAVDTVAADCESVLLPGSGVVPVETVAPVSVVPAPVLAPDGDRDGVADPVDRCPALAGPSAREGCPTGLLADPSIAYRRVKGGIRVVAYYVIATTGARVTVSCSRGCRSSVATGRGAKRVRVAALNGRRLANGVKITVAVSAPGRLTTTVVDRITNGQRREGRPACAPVTC